MLDVTTANRFSIRFVGKTRNERLADHYLERSGIAGIWIDATSGDTGALQAVSTARLPGKIIVCVSSFPDAMQLARECYLYRDMSVADRAAMRGIGLSLHEDVIARALHAVEVVNRRIREMQQNGGMRPINQAFKEQRKQEPGLRYNDFLHRHKEQLLEAMTRALG